MPRPGNVNTNDKCSVRNLFRALKLKPSDIDSGHDPKPAFDEPIRLIEAWKEATEAEIDLLVCTDLFSLSN